MRLTVAAPWVFVVAVVAPLIDIAVGLAVGFPLPVLSLLGVGLAVEVRRMAVRRATTGATAARPTLRT